MPNTFNLLLACISVLHNKNRAQLLELAIMLTFLDLNSQVERVLIDSGATHSFTSKSLACKPNLWIKKVNN